MNIKYGLCWSVMLLRIFSDSFTVNVAFQKTGLFCGRTGVSGKVFDGDINYVNSIRLQHDGCGPANLRVNLGRPYSIQYIVLYHGEGNRDLLNFFYAVLVENKLCGNFPFLIKPLGKGMRINCIDTNILSASVEIKTLEAGDLYISEFEVHSFALESETYVLLHRGCYAEIGAPDSTLSWEKCQKTCFDQNFIFAAIKANKICGCTNKPDEASVLDDDKCDILCDGGQRYCGGESGFSVYIIKPPLPHFDGCYAKNGEPSGHPMDITHAKCLHLCIKHPYFILTKINIGGEYYDTCVCNNRQMSGLRSYENYCHSICKGEPEHLCGSYKGIIQIRTCIRDNALTCNDIMRCNGEHDLFGACVKGCVEGYVGEHCMQKVFTIPETTQLFDIFEGSGFKLNKNMLMIIGLSLLLLCCLGMLMCGGDSDYDSSSSS